MPICVLLNTILINTIQNNTNLTNIKSTNNKSTKTKTSNCQPTNTKTKSGIVFFQIYIFLICIYASMYDPRTCCYRIRLEMTHTCMFNLIIDCTRVLLYNIVLLYINYFWMSAFEWKYLFVEVLDINSKELLVFNIIISGPFEGHRHVHNSTYFDHRPYMTIFCFHQFCLRSLLLDKLVNYTTQQNI